MSDLSCRTMIRLVLVGVTCWITTSFGVMAVDGGDHGAKQDAPRRLENGRPVTIEVSPVTTPIGMTRRFRYLTESTCRLRIHAYGDGLDSKLTVDIPNAVGSEDKRRLTDDDSGSGKNASVEVTGVEESVVVEIEVRVMPTTSEDVVERSGEKSVTVLTLTVVLHELERDPDLEPLIVKWTAKLAEADAAVKTGNLGAGRSLLRDVFDGCEDEEAFDDVEVVERVLDRAGAIARNCRDAGSVLRARRPHLAQRRRTFPPRHSELVDAMEEVGIGLAMLDKLDEADVLFRQVLEAREATLPADSPGVLAARANRAGTLAFSGQIEEALDLRRQVLEACRRLYHADHRERLKARYNLASSLYSLGRIREALDHHIVVLRARERTLRQNHPDIQVSTAATASCLKAVGRVRQALVLEREVLEGFERTLPEDHPRLTKQRANLARTLRLLGQDREALEIQRQVVTTFERTLSPGHRLLLEARASMAVGLSRLGESAAAAEILREVVSINDRKTPQDHPFAVQARASLASSLFSIGKKDEAIRLFRGVIESMERRAANEFFLTVQSGLAVALAGVGEFDEALALQRDVVEAMTRTLPDDEVFVMEGRSALAWIAAGAGNRETTERAVAELWNALRRSTHGLRRTVSASEVAEFVASLRKMLFTYFSFDGAIRRAVDDELVAVEEWSNIRTFNLRREKLAAGASRIAEEHKDELRDVDRRIERALRIGDSDAVRTLSAERRKIRRGLAKATPGTNDDRPLRDADFDPTELARDTLEIGQVAIRFWTYGRWDFRFDRDTDESRVARAPPYMGAHLLAYVVEHGGRIGRVEFGPIRAINEAVSDYRLAVMDEGRATSEVARTGARTRRRSAEADLRGLLVKPLVAATKGARRWTMASDGSLHGLPWEALSVDDVGTRLGESVQVEYRTTLREMVVPHVPVDRSRGRLVAFGGLDFDAAEDVETDGGARDENVSIAAFGLHGLASERAGSSRKFDALTASRQEVETIASLHRRAFGEVADDEKASPLVLSGKTGTRRRLERSASEACYLHLATHAYYLPERFKSTVEFDAESASTPKFDFDSARNVAVGIMPHALCGIALAGSNLEIAAERRGLFDRRHTVSGSELSQLDLSGCDLAVLSACEGNVGVTRIGNGIASLQEALQIAGVRSVVSALWPVPDEVTKDLMITFYEELWLKKKTKAEALRAAKRRFRDAKDDKGRPRYVVRDWAGWVLTGEPK